MTSFNLVDSPWIPAIMINGDNRQLSLLEVFALAPHIKEVIGDSPQFTLGLHRLILCLAHRIYDPVTPQEWSTLWKKGLWPAADFEAYFKDWHNAFDLFGEEKPFYQAQNPKAKIKSVVNIILHLPSGNNPLFFTTKVESAGVTVTAAYAAQALLSMNYSSLCGLSSIVGWVNVDAPCGRGIAFIPIGRNFFETIMLNVVPATFNPLSRSKDVDVPVWEQPIPDVEATSRPLKGYTDYLSWLARRIKLIPVVIDGNIFVREVSVAPGLRLPEAIRDPMQAYYDEDRGGGPVRFQEELALWHHQYAIQGALGIEGDDVTPPLTIISLKRLVDLGYLDPTVVFQLLALGAITSSGKATIRQNRSERLPLPLQYLVAGNNQADRLRQALSQAVAASRKLYGAVRTLVEESHSANVDPRRVQQLAAATFPAYQRRYWALLEKPFFSLLLSPPDNPLPQWEEQVRLAARTAFQQDGQGLGVGSVGMRAAVMAGKRLNGGLKGIFINEEETDG